MPVLDIGETIGVLAELFIEDTKSIPRSSLPKFGQINNIKRTGIPPNTSF
jgi:hypothetical protein